MWYLYVLRCKGGSFYTGITTNVARRVIEHQAGRGAKYTQTHRPVTLLAAWRYPDRSTATQVEYQFKQLSHRAKAAWVEGCWPFMGGPFAHDVLDETAEVLRFCPRCGGLRTDQEVAGAVVSTCTLCGRRQYVNAKPAAGLLLLRRQQVLLVRRTCEPFAGHWDIPGGFLDPDELPETGAVREVKEETGLDAQVVDFLGFYLDHYDFQGERYPLLNIYFVGQAEGEACPNDEADACAWFALDALPDRIAFAHAPRVLDDLQAWMSARAG